MRWWILGILLCGCVDSEEEFTTQLRIESPASPVLYFGDVAHFTEPQYTDKGWVCDFSALGEFDGGVDLGQTF